MNHSPLQSTESRAHGSVPAISRSKPDGIETCWHEIGVYGDGSCEELKNVIHCRNCRIFSAAAHRLVDRPLLDAYRQEWTAHFARKQAPVAPARLSAVLFRINSEWLALPTQAFQEVAERRRIHSIPHRRNGVMLGLVNIRGEILICSALSRLLGLEPATAGAPSRTTYDRLLVAQWEGSRLVFPVDEVPGIHRFQSHELRDAPATVARSDLRFSQGILLWRDRTVGLLDPGLLFPALNSSLS